MHGLRFGFLLTILILSSSAKAFEFRPTSLDHLSLDLERYSCRREPMTPQIPCEDYKGQVQLNFKVGLFNDFLKWSNRLHGEGTDAKFTTLGWEYYLSIPTPWNIEPFLHHHSQHTFDMDQPTINGRPKPEKFPVSDGVGIRFTFFNKGDK